MTIELLRQMLHAIPRGDPIQEVLHEAITRIDRDVVDAKRQLELGQEGGGRGRRIPGSGPRRNSRRESSGAAP